MKQAATALCVAALIVAGIGKIAISAQGSVAVPFTSAAEDSQSPPAAILPCSAYAGRLGDNMAVSCSD
jgi:hypothetical protein